MSTQGTGTDFNRRRFLRRAATVGAAAAWATPVVKTITGTPAFAQGVAGSPPGGGDYSLTVCYTIAAPVGDTGPGDTGSGGGGILETEGTEQSCVDPTQGGPGAEYFSVSMAGGGDNGGSGSNSAQSTQTIQVSLTPTGVAAGASIVSASAGCGPGVVSPAGDYATISCAE